MSSGINADDFDETQKIGPKGDMNIQEKFIESIERFLADKKVKNIYQLSMAAGVDQAALSSFMKTHYYEKGKGEKPARMKKDIYLEGAGKVIDYMGGILVFPWDQRNGDAEAEIARLQKENEKLKAENTLLDKKLYACEQMRQKFEDMITQQLPTVNDVPVEIRQNKSSA